MSPSLSEGGPGGESAAGGGEVGSATDLSPGLGGGGQGPGWHMGGGGVNTLPCHPPDTRPISFVLRNPLWLDAVGVSCLHCPSEEGGQVSLLSSCPPLTLECSHTSASVKWEQETRFTGPGLRTHADVERARRAPRPALSSEASQLTPGVGPLMPILQMKRLRPGGENFPSVTQLTTGRAKPPARLRLRLESTLQTPRLYTPSPFHRFSPDSFWE